MQRKADFRWCDDLGSAVVDGDETSAKRFVAGDDAIQRPLQGGQIQFAVKVHPAGQQIGLCGTGIELGQEPEALLRKRQRQSALALHRHDRRQCAGYRAAQDDGDVGQARLGKQRCQGQFDAQCAADARDQPYRQQGMTTQGEETVVAADLVDAEQLAP